MIFKYSLLVKTFDGSAKTDLRYFFPLALSTALFIQAGEAVISLAMLLGGVSLLVALPGVIQVAPHYFLDVKSEHGFHASFQQLIFGKSHKSGHSQQFRYLAVNGDFGKVQGPPDATHAQREHQGVWAVILALVNFSLAIMSGIGKIKGLFKYGCNYQSFEWSVR